MLLELGDMLVAADPPAKMMKALAAISTRAHQAYDEVSGLPPGTSHDLCLFMSLAVRDFLVNIGYADATVRGCALYIVAADQDDKEIWSIGTGVPGQADEPNKFNGHAVCTVPSLNLLIDTTVYQSVRPHWCGAVKGMMVTNYFEPNPAAFRKLYGCHVIAIGEKKLDDRTVAIAWLDRPELQWRKTDDFRVRNARRIAVTKALVEGFGEWRDE
jgi:hypothetical protein